MRQDQERWLDEKIQRDLMDWADEEERLLMEDKELKGIHLSADSLANIHERLAKEAEEEKAPTVEIAEEKEAPSAEMVEDEKAPTAETAMDAKAGKRSGRVRIRMALVLAAALALVVGMGVASSGKRLFSPEIQQKDRGDEVHVKVNNAEVPESQYDEEEVCQEIQEELGVLPVRFGYRPEGMTLKECNFFSGNMVVITYDCNGKNIHVLISKDFNDSVIDWQTDGELIGSMDPVKIESCKLEVPVQIYEDEKGEQYYNINFEYLNTYYDINGMLEEGDFKNLIENIAIKNV